MSINTIHLTIDLGLDTAKVAYAYVENGTYRYGKLSHDGAAFPAWAYYNELKEVWSYGHDAARFDDGKSYKNLVKVKSLIMLLQNEENHSYYAKGDQFPNFYFPNKVVFTRQYENAVNDGHTFTANMTPRAVCLDFFRALFTTCIFPALSKLRGFDQKTTVICPTVLYPAAAAERTIMELKWLVWRAAASFANEYLFYLNHKTQMVGGLLASKANAIYAQKIGALSDHDTTLIFNIGESDLSVSKVSIERLGDDTFCLAVDGTDGHLPPEEVGGNCVDEMIKGLLDKKLDVRVPLGQSESTRISESGTYKQQYNLMRTIKKTKEYFSSDLYTKFFSDGIPFSVMRDLVYDIPLTREDIQQELTASPASVGCRVANYVIKEILSDDAHPDRTHANTVLFVGGAAETYGLIPYVTDTARECTRSDIRWIRLDEAVGGTGIEKNENEVYAAACGGALYSAGYVKLKTLLRKFYGTWMTRASDPLKIKYFAPFKYKNGIEGGARPGEVIPAGGARYHTKEFALGKNATVRDELFSVDRLPYSGDMQIGNIDTSMRFGAIRDYGLRVLCCGRIVNLSTVPIVCIEGVDVNEDGRAKPFIRTKDPANAPYVKFEFDGEFSLLG